MSEIKALPKKDIGRYVDILAEAYPGMNIVTDDDKKNAFERHLQQARDPRITTFGYYRDGDLLGGIKLYDYTMNLFGIKLPAIGGGALAVDLMHKKEHVARDLMTHFIGYALKKNAPLAILWPFRPDFYKSMGWGIGSKMHVYRIKPNSFPNGESKEHVRMLTRDDIPMLTEFYNRVGAKTNGMIDESEFGWELIFDRFKAFRFVGYENDGELHGYFIYSFLRKEMVHFLDNKMRIIEMVYDSPKVLSEFCTFLHTQNDQIDIIELQTHDDSFHHLLKDPRNDANVVFPSVHHQSNTSGVGIMYRVVNVRRLFELLADHNFGKQTCKLKLTIADNFVESNDGSLVVHFSRGLAQVKEDHSSYDVELRLDIADFSSLIMGAVDLNSLYTYSLANLTDPEYLETLNKLFVTDHKPVTFIAF